MSKKPPVVRKVVPAPPEPAPPEPAPQVSVYQYQHPLSEVLSPESEAQARSVVDYIDARSAFISNLRRYSADLESLAKSAEVNHHYGGILVVSDSISRLCSESGRLQDMRNMLMYKQAAS